MDKMTMRHFDEMCLTPVKPLTPRQIAAIREQEMASQAVFARHLGVSVNLISQWERGEKKPQGASLKLLTLVKKNRPRLSRLNAAKLEKTQGASSSRGRIALIGVPASFAGGGELRWASR